MVIKIKKKLKILGIILLVLIAIIAVVKIRDLIIIKKISIELDKLANYSNIHITTKWSNGNESESFRKDNTKLTKNSLNNTATKREIYQWINTDTNEEIMYFEADGKKIANVSEIHMGDLEFKVNSLCIGVTDKSITIFQRIIALFYVKPITYEKIDGQVYYKLSDLQNYSNLYINKENLEVYKNELNNKSEVVIYELKKDVVTEDDVKRPDLSEYVVTMN